MGLLKKAIKILYYDTDTKDFELYSFQQLKGY